MCSTYDEEASCKENLKRCSRKTNKCVEPYVSKRFLLNSGRKEDFLDSVKQNSKGRVRDRVKDEQGFRMPHSARTQDAIELLDQYEKEQMEEQALKKLRVALRKQLRDELKLIPTQRERDEWFEMTHNSDRWDQAGLQRPPDKEERELAKRLSRERYAAKKRALKAVSKKAGAGSRPSRARKHHRV
jgi:hypothetical protein